MHGLVCTKPENIFIINNSSLNTRGHKFKLGTQQTNCNLRHNFFSIRVVPIWNELPAHIVEAVSLITFKRLIKSCDFSKYCNVDPF